MKSALLLALVLTGSCVALASPLGVYQHGTVIRMRMGDCALTHRGFMSTFGPPQGSGNEGSCPQYVLMTDKIVFVIVGKSSNQLVPLSEIIDFRLQNRELAVRVDDARHESKFAIKEMTLRSEWERIQRHIEGQFNEPRREPVDTSLARRNPD